MIEWIAQLAVAITPKHFANGHCDRGTSGDGSGSARVSADQMRVDGIYTIGNDINCTYGSAIGLEILSIVAAITAGFFTVS